MAKPSLHQDPFATALWRVAQTCVEIAAVVTAPDTVLPDLQRVAALSTTAMESYEALLRPYMEEAVDFYRFRSQARQCCAWGHPYEALAKVYTAVRARYMDAHGDLTTRHLAFVGER